MDDQNGAINWLLSQKRIQASASVRNGNTTVNHKEIVGFIDQAIAALTPRHEAPAEPCFECGSTERTGTACKPCNPEITDPNFGHEAPASEGEREPLCMAYKTGYAEGVEDSNGMFDRESCEEGWGQYAEKLSAQPDAPSADKLREAVEAIWEIAGGRATDGHNEAGRLERIKDRAAEILAVLKAEGA